MVGEGKFLKVNTKVLASPPVLNPILVYHRGAILAFPTHESDQF